MAEAPSNAQWAAQLRAALDAMLALQQFAPRVAGALVHGRLEKHQPLVLHLCAEHADQVRAVLDQLGIPARTLQSRLRVPRDVSRALPGFGFLAGAYEFVIWVFDEGSFRQRLRVGDETEPAARMTRRALEDRLRSLELGASER